MALEDARRIDPRIAEPDGGKARDLIVVERIVTVRDEMRFDRDQIVDQFRARDRVVEAN